MKNDKSYVIELYNNWDSTRALIGREECLHEIGKEYVNMIVTSRCFAFRALITQAQIEKSFWIQNSTSLLYLPIPSSAETWNIFTNKLCEFWFRLSWRFKREKSAKEELITRASLRVHDFATGKNFSFNQYHNKEFSVFLGKVIL